MDYKENRMSTDATGKMGGKPKGQEIFEKIYKKKQWRPPSKKKKGKNLSPRNMKACHSVSTFGQKIRGTLLRLYGNING
jgi:hypothetical protein